MKMKLYFYIFLSTCCQILSGQMTMHPGNIEPLTPDNIIENVFLGNGIEIVSTTYSGIPGSIGLFDNATNEIGLEKGIVLSTGFAANVIKPNSEENPISSNTTGDTYSDPDLESLADVKVVDVAKFDITFIPSSDQLSFRYVFASEEYPDFVCADNNDVFGFFISGKKPGGGEYVSENIALVPDPADTEAYLDLPVAINTVNSGSPGQYSSGNCDGPRQSLDYSEFYNEVAEGQAPALNGYLDVFIAKAKVIPCETYTIKIVIGDGTDQNEDSVVFLEERSFSTGTLKIDINNPGINGGLAEGCDSGSLRLKLPNPVTTDFPIEMEVLYGAEQLDAAIPGEDFVGLPDNVFIPAGASYVDLDLQPLDDNIDEGTEYIYIKIRKGICAVDTLVLPLYNNDLETVTVPDTIYACKDEFFQLKADLGDNVNPSSILTFDSSSETALNKNNSHTESSISIFGLKDIALNPSIISEICIDSLVHPRLNDLDIYLKAPSQQIIELSTDNGNRPDNDNQTDAFVKTCFTINASTNINLGNASEGTLNLGNPTYTGNYLPEGSFEEWLSPISSTLNGDYTLFIVDDKQDFDGTLYKWHISFNPKYDLDYAWMPDASLQCSTCETAIGKADASRYYYIDFSDSYGCAATDSVWVQVTEKAEAINVVCESNTTGTITYSWESTNNASFYEFRILGSQEWLNFNENDIAKAGTYIFSKVDATTLDLTGLLANETMTVEFRANNNANCASLVSTATCTAIDCQDIEPTIVEINVEQPECASQTTARVDIIASSTFMPLIYRVSNDQFTIENNTGTFFALTQGQWTTRIIDNQGCAIERAFTINSPNPIRLNENIKPITCAGDNNAAISLSPTGSNPPFSFRWNDGNTDAERIDLKPNFYTVTVTDANDCTAVLDIQIEDPEPLQYSYIQNEPINCSGTNEVTATLDILGGVAPYTTIWNDSIEQDTLYNVSAGTLVFEIIDANGCTVRIDGQEVNSRSLTVEYTNRVAASCSDTADGSVTVNVSNGTAPFSAIWSNTETGLSPTALNAGVNSVTITDTNGCVIESSITVDSPDPIAISSLITAPSCYQLADGTVALIADDLSTEYTYLWEDGASTDTRADLAAGTYGVTITDINGCSTEQTLEVPTTSELSATYDLTKVSCDLVTKGTITLQVSGGSGQYLYDWKGPNNYNSTNRDLSNLETGIYTVIIKDAVNPDCQSEPLSIEMTMESAITIDIQVSNSISCNGDSNGSLLAITSGGAAPYQYLWENNLTTNEISGLTAGTYELTVRDSDNCSTTLTKTLEQPEALTGNIAEFDILCFGENSGRLEANIAGGATPYSYAWGNGSQEAILTNLAEGNYSLVVTDANNCSIDLTATIEETTEEMIVETDVKHVSCADGNNGVISITPINGVGPFQYSLNGGPFDTNPVLDRLQAGEYTVTIKDSNACIVEITLTIENPEPLEIEFKNKLEVTYGENLQIELDIQNAENMQSFTWSAPKIEDFSCINCMNPMISTITKSFSGSLMIIDSESCASQIFFNVNVIEEGRLDVPTGFSPNGDGINDILYVMGDPDLIVKNFDIYSRWGEHVFHAEDFNPGDISNGWNGTTSTAEPAQDSYMWVIEYEMASGKTEVRRGQTTLIK